MAQPDSPPPDLLSIGSHCALPECRQLDFLPFRCGACAKTFCLEHRSAAAHACAAAAGAAGPELVVCPLCSKGVRLAPGQDPDAAVEAHSRSPACEPANYARVHAKPRCPVPGCRERLSAVTAFDCRACGARVCLRHRLAADHGCAPRAAPAAAAPGAAALARLRAWGGVFGAGGKAAAPAAKAPAARQQQQQQRQGRGTGAAGAAAAQRAPAEVVDLTSPASARGGGAAAERCAECGAAFPTVQALIDHAAAAHSRGWSSGALGGGGGGGGAGPGGREVCPRCGARFPDAVALVAHVEAAHSGGGGARSAECVLS